MGIFNQREAETAKRFTLENIFTVLSTEDPGGLRDIMKMPLEDVLFMLQNIEEFSFGTAFVAAILVGKFLNALG